MTSNPIMLRELRRFRNAGPLWWLALLLVWVVATYVLRVALTGYIQLYANGPLPLVVYDIISGFLFFFLRPELLLVLYFFSRMLTPEDWAEEQPHLAPTLLTPREVAIGKVIVPLGVLVGLNLLTGPILYYQYFTDGISTLGFTKAELIAYIATIGPLALMEDLLIAVLIVLYAFYCTIARGARGSGPAMRIVGFAAVLAVLAQIAVALVGLIPMPSVLSAWEFFFWLVLPEVAFFLIMLPLEILLIRWVWKGAVRQVAQRLGDGGS